jgi:hypothetical protein
MLERKPVFGRRQGQANGAGVAAHPAPAPTPTADLAAQPAPTPAAQGPAQLPMAEVSRLSIAASRRRGFPEDALEEVAWRVVWLERRGLPGLRAMIREYAANRGTPLQSRVGSQGADGIFRWGCPLIAGTLLLDQFDELMALDPRGAKAISGPDNGVLLLPKVAQYAGPRGLLIRVSWVIDGQIRAQSFVDGYRVATLGDPEALLENTQVGFAPHLDDAPAEMRAGHLEQMLLPAADMRILAELTAS